MAKYHISSSGDPKKCSATERPCPLGGEAEHYESMEAGYAAMEKMMAELKTKPANPLQLELDGSDDKYGDAAAVRAEFSKAQEEALQASAEGKFAVVVQLSREFSYEYDSLAYESEPQEDDFEDEDSFEAAKSDWEEEVYSFERNFDLGGTSANTIDTEFQVVTFESAYDFQRARNDDAGIEGVQEYATLTDFNGPGYGNVLNSDVDRNLDSDCFERSTVYLYPPKV